MRRLGKLAVLPFAEYESLMCRCEDAEAHAGDFAALLHHSETMRDMEKETNRAQRKRAFEAGKFHAAGGYSHTLPKLKEELLETKQYLAMYQAETQLLSDVNRNYSARLDYWRPFIAALETVPGCLMRIDDCSDNMAPADFAAVGEQVATERRQP